MPSTFILAKEHKSDELMEPDIGCVMNFNDLTACLRAVVFFTLSSYVEKYTVYRQSSPCSIEHTVCVCLASQSHSFSNAVQSLGNTSQCCQKEICTLWCPVPKKRMFQWLNFISVFVRTSTLNNYLHLYDPWPTTNHRLTNHMSHL